MTIDQWLLTNDYWPMTIDQWLLTILLWFRTNKSYRRRGWVTCPLCFILEDLCVLSKKNPAKQFVLRDSFNFCGERGIRTPGTPKGTTDFESATIDHSASSPVAANVKIPSKQRATFPTIFRNRSFSFSVQHRCQLHSRMPNAFKSPPFGILFGKKPTHLFI